jgi:hypothetical protein
MMHRKPGNVARRQHAAQPSRQQQAGSDAAAMRIAEMLWIVDGSRHHTDVEHPLPYPWQRSGSRIAMNEQEFQSKLAELMGEISTLPATERAKLEKLADETRQRHERLKQTVSSLQESLDYLRLSIKYLVFDLEATRRENGYLRKMLEETSSGE